MSKKKHIDDTFDEFLDKRELDLIARNDARMLELFGVSIDESDTQRRRDEAVRRIDSDEWDMVEPDGFHRSLSKSKHPRMLTDYTESELADMRLYKLSGHDIGFALKKFKDGTYTEIVSVYNNEPDIKHIGDTLMRAIIRNGGRHLDHFDGYLSRLYTAMGFVETRRERYDPQHDPDGEFRDRYGERDVIYRTYKGQTK